MGDGGGGGLEAIIYYQSKLYTFSILFTCFIAVACGFCLFSMTCVEIFGEKYVLTNVVVIY